MQHKYLLAAALLAAAAFDAQGQSLNGFCVYQEYQVIARTFAPRHWFFLPDGKYLNDAPHEELSAQGMEKACAKYPGECGQYAVAGAKLNLTPRKGKPWSADFKSAGANWEIGGIACQRINFRYPANAKLNGRYTAGSGFGGVRSASTYEFSPDGTYSIANVGAVSTSAGGGVSTNAKRGTYKLSANTLELTANGQTTRHLIYELPAGGTNTQMLIDGLAWKKN